MREIGVLAVADDEHGCGSSGGKGRRLALVSSVVTWSFSTSRPVLRAERCWVRSSSRPDTLRDE